MKSVGIDVASRGWAAIGLVIDGKLDRALAWKPPDKKASSPENLLAWHKWLRIQLFVIKPDIVAVEQIAGFQNRQVIHSLAKHEGVALLTAKMVPGAIVINPNASQSRSVVFGKGNLSKDDAWVAFRKQFPDFPLLAKTSGGVDQMDAMVHALAAPTVLERH